MEDLKRLLGSHPFFKDMKEEYIAFLAGCGKNVRFEPGEFI
ncbi:MAG TPA: Crp/Fnr family transcriptional regulator, partial [Calditrichae bacterium]|nr:Crp/Fnr family transcriptional regulator [Calditrichia bacterium]